MRTVQSFRSELEKIALGWKAKALGVAVPAALGYGLYRAGRFAKREIIDDTKRRDHEALHGYDSPMNQQQMTSPYGPYVY